MKYLVGKLIYECAAPSKHIGKTIKTKRAKKYVIEQLIECLKIDLEDEKLVSKHIKWVHREIDPTNIPYRKDWEELMLK